MKTVKGTRTERNLLTAFVGESSARNRYTYYAGVARKEGFMQIAGIFEETANQEKEHGKRFFKFLDGGSLEVCMMLPAGVIGTTVENLRAAAAGEHEEWSQLYPQFALIAREDGLAAIATVFEKIAIAEKQHEKRYLELLRNVENGRVFKKDSRTTWRCLNCGFIHDGLEAPELCPACAHPMAYFEVLGENW